MRHIRLTFVFVSCFAWSANCQELPRYNHYYANPFFYNPSFAAGKERTEVSLLYRQQWTGLQDAPRFTNLTLVAPLGKVGIGVNLQNTVRGIITTSSVQLAAGYRISITKYSSLSFGLSGGIGRNLLDMDQVDPNDPTIARILSNSYFIEGQAGVNFRYKSLIIAMSLPQLFDNSIVDTQSLQTVKVNPFGSSITSIRVKFPIAREVHLEPIALVRFFQGNIQMESTALFHFGENLWLGGLWRQHYGAAGLAGFQVKKALQVNYAYEFPAGSSDIAFITHEFRIALLLGNGKTLNASEPAAKPMPASWRRH